MAEVGRLAAISKVTSNAKWENDTDARLGRARQADYQKNLEDQAAGSLFSRRNQLAQLYEMELELWKRTLEGNKETPLDRKEKIKARAMALRAQRKAEQEEYVNHQTQRQWRDSCDDLRQLDSQMTLNDVAERRKEQLGEKARQQFQELEDEKQWSNAWEVDRLQKEARERNDLARQHQRNTEMRRDLDLQCTQRKTKDGLLTNLEVEETTATKMRWEKEKQLQDEHNLCVKAAMRQEGQRVLQYNNERLSIRTETAKTEMQNDLVLLQVALSKERQELEDEEEKKRQEKETTKMYQAHLRQQMIKEKADDSLYEALRRQDEEKAAAKRDAQYGREQHARSELQQAVHAGRHGQMEAAAAKAARETETERVYAAHCKSEATRLDQVDQEMKNIRKTAVHRNRNAVQLQIAGKQTMNAREQQRTYLENKTQQYHEKKYQQQLATVIGR